MIKVLRTPCTNNMLITEIKNSLECRIRKDLRPPPLEIYNLLFPSLALLN
jgi:hypothetical protein